MASQAGLEPHVTIMLGYPWETEEMAKNTIALSKRLFKKGYVETMQATIVVPYPGTPLYKQCLENDWLKVDPTDYEAFDMRGTVMKIPFPEERLYELTQELYSSFFTPRYVLKRLSQIRSPSDVKFLTYSAWKLVGHLLDFDKAQTKVKWTSPKFWVDAGKSMFTHLFSKKEDAKVEDRLKESVEIAEKEKASIKL